MQRLLLFSLLAILLFPVGSPARAQQATATPSPEPPLALLAVPLPGQALQGGVPITGSTAVEGFGSALLEFAYTGDPTRTWFLIGPVDAPVEDGNLAQWDTTTITDGVYDLRLTVELQDGSRVTAFVSGLRVRNYTAVETDTPAPPVPTDTPVPGDTPVPTITPTPTVSPVPPTFTPLPPNPASFSTLDLVASMGRGVLAVVGVFSLMAIYMLIRVAARQERRNSQ